MKLHFVGIGGIGISGVAQFCAERGDEVSGSDLAQSEVWPILERSKIKLFQSHSSQNVPADADAVIYSAAVPESNVERVSARIQKIPEFSSFAFLGQISKNFRTIAVAGTHGKTTTTGLISAGFLDANFGANVFCGSTLREFGGSNFWSGGGEFFLVEACEYRENFKFLNPEIVILTTVQYDHPDFFADEEAYLAAFARFSAGAKMVIFHRKDKNAQKVLQNFGGKKVAVAEDFGQNLALQIAGKKNRENAALALKLAQKLELDEKRFCRGMSNFSGAARRQEFLGEKFGAKIFDDYAHHPNEIEAVLQAFEQKYPQKKIGIIFESHQFSRTRKFLHDFAAALAKYHSVGVFPIYPCRDSEADKKDFSHLNLVAQVPRATPVQSFEDAKSFLQREKPDILIFAGAGKISAFAREFLARG